MKTFILLTLSVFSAASALFGAGPVIEVPGPSNSASYAQPTFPDGGVAQGSIFTLFGDGLGPSTIAYSTALPLPATLSGTSVSVTVKGTTMSCYMVYTVNGQVAAILPSTTPVGTGTISVTYNGTPSPTVPFVVVPNALGIFARNQQGSGPAVVQDAGSNYNSFTNSFEPGETVTFWGTGLGAIAGSDAATPSSGPLPGNPAVTANIGGQSAVVQYAGRSGFAGEDQLNVTIPSGVSGCYVPVYFTVNGVPSNFLTMSIEPNGGICSDAGLYPSAVLSTIANGSPINTGGVFLEQFSLAFTFGTFSTVEESESGGAGFSTFSASTFLDSLGGLAPNAAISDGCMVRQFNQGAAFTDPETGQGLDAGSEITVSGPNGSKNLIEESTGGYSATFVTPSLTGKPTDFLTPGSYTLSNGSGGKAVGAFSVNITIPPVLTWTNISAVSTVPRTQPLTIDWTGGSTGGLVYVVGTSPLAINSDNTYNGAAQFVCVAPQAAGTLTVPAAVLSALPASANITQDGTTAGGGAIVVSSGSNTQATVPGLDFFDAGASTGQGKLGITFR